MQTSEDSNVRLVAYVHPSEVTDSSSASHWFQVDNYSWMPIEVSDSSLAVGAGLQSTPPVGSRGSLGTVFSKQSSRQVESTVLKDSGTASNGSHIHVEITFNRVEVEREGIIIAPSEPIPLAVRVPVIIR